MPVKIHSTNTYYYTPPIKKKTAYSRASERELIRLLTSKPSQIGLQRPRYAPIATPPKLKTSCTSISTQAVNTLLSKNVSLFTRTVSCITKWVLLARPDLKITQLFNKTVTDFSLSLTALELPKKFFTFCVDVVEFKNNPSWTKANKLFFQFAGLFKTTISLIVRAALFPAKILGTLLKISGVGKLATSINSAFENLKKLAKEFRLGTKKVFTNVINLSRDFANIAFAGLSLAGATIAPGILLTHTTTELFFTFSGI